MIRDYYSSEDERQAAIGTYRNPCRGPDDGPSDHDYGAGTVSARRSTVSGDGHKHYAVVRDFDDGRLEIARNLTNTDQDNLDDATRMAQRLDHGPFGNDVAGYHAHRIA